MYLTISTRRSVSEAHRYFKSFLQYIQKKFPMNDEVMDNAAVWIDVKKEPGNNGPSSVPTR